MTGGKEERAAVGKGHINRRPLTKFQRRGIRERRGKKKPTSVSRGVFQKKEGRCPSLEALSSATGD